MRAKRPPWLRRSPPGSGVHRAHFTRGKTTLAKFGLVREDHCRQTMFLRLRPDMQPAFQGGFCYFGFWVRGLRDVHTDHSAHRASLHQYPAQSNRAGYALVRKAILHLDDSTGSMAFSESEQSKNGAGEMVPLYATRVQDLGTDDFVIIKCGACGYIAELWPGLLTRGLGLKPTDKVLDLERRFRCRLCYAREQATVSIRWKARI